MKKQKEKMQRETRALEKKRQSAEKKAAQLKKQQADAKKKAAAVLKKLQQEKQHAASEIKKLQQDLKEAKLKKIAEDKKQKQLIEEALTAQIEAENTQQQKTVSRERNIEKERYRLLYKQKVSEYLVWQGSDEANCTLQVRLAPAGLVLDVTVAKGNAQGAYCRAAQAAVFKASPLPTPSDQALFDEIRDITFNMRASG